MSGLELRISGIGGDRTAYCATITALLIVELTKQKFHEFKLGSSQGCVGTVAMCSKALLEIENEQKIKRSQGSPPDMDGL